MQHPRPRSSHAGSRECFRACEVLNIWCKVLSSVREAALRERGIYRPKSPAAIFVGVNRVFTASRETLLPWCRKKTPPSKCRFRTSASQLASRSSLLSCICYTRCHGNGPPLVCANIGQQPRRTTPPQQNSTCIYGCLLAIQKVQDKHVSIQPCRWSSGAHKDAECKCPRFEIVCQEQLRRWFVPLSIQWHEYRNPRPPHTHTHTHLALCLITSWWS